MRNCVQKPEDESVLRNRRGGGSNGFFSVRSLSNYVRIVSSGASNVASSVRKAGASIVSSMADSYDDSGRDQVIWAGFDKLEREGNGVRQVLLLGYRSGFQVWDVEKADDVRQLVSRHDASASFLQMQKMPMASKGIVDKFADVRPLLIVVGDGITANCNNSDGFGSPTNSFSSGCHQELGSDSFLPTHVRFYSLMSHEYVHVVKFRSAVFSVRSSPRIIAVCQASQIHCFNPATLDRIYTILTHPVVSESPYPGSIGYGPLAVGARWLAYSGNLIGVSRNCVANPRDISPVIVAPSNGSLMAHFARESSKKLASGMVALGDMGYTTLAKYYSELTSETNATVHGSSNVKGNGTMHTEPADLEHDGMVIVRDIASRSVIVQFVAHKSPISALTFDPSGTLLVTASIHGHNINVFHIIPSSCARTEGSEAKGTSIHLYKLQRGITNAVIQDISFSDDGKWIIISSSRGTSHLFAIGYSREAYTKFNKSDLTNLYYGSALQTKTFAHSFHNFASSKICENSFLYSNPITLSAVSRIKNGNPMLKSAVSGVAAAATGKLNPFYGTVASVFHNCNTTRLHEDISSLKAAYYILVYSPTGSIIQYVFHPKSRDDSGNDLSVSGSVTYGLTCESDARLVIEALQKWDVCHKRNRRDRCDNFDMYNDHGCGENFPQKGIKKGTSVYPSTNQTDPKRKLAAKQSHHMYISEIELHTHEAVGPLWLKSEVFFEVLMDHCSKEDHGRNSGGENDIERIPCRTVKARSKDLVPIFDSLQSSKLPETRTVDSDFTKNGSLFHHKSKVSEVGKHSCRSSCNTSDYSSENTKIAELTAGNNENGRGHHTQETEGIVNNHANTTDKECKPEFATHRGPS